MVEIGTFSAVGPSFLSLQMVRLLQDPLEKGFEAQSPRRHGTWETSGYGGYSIEESLHRQVVR